MPKVMSLDEQSEPVHIALFCMQAVMKAEQTLLDLAQQPGGSQHWLAWFVVCVNTMRVRKLNCQTQTASSFSGYEYEILYDRVPC